jgi:hypothetical protein
MLKSVPDLVRGKATQKIARGETVMRSQDAEQVLAQLQRAEIEMRFAAADLSHFRALADFPELENALRALGSVMTRLRRSVDSDGDQPHKQAN